MAATPSLPRRFGIDIKLQLDLNAHVPAAQVLAGTTAPCGWQLNRTNPDGLC